MNKKDDGPLKQPQQQSSHAYKKSTVAILLLLSYLCLTAGQVSAKLAGTVLGPEGAETGSRLAPGLIEKLSGSQIAHLALAFAIGTYVFFLLRGLLWVFLLRKLKLVLAYPLMSLGYILVLAASFFLFHETLTLSKLGGALLIMSGVSLVSFGEVRQKKADQKKADQQKADQQKAKSPPSAPKPPSSPLSRSAPHQQSSDSGGSKHSSDTRGPHEQ